jgi:hypothetical protein
MKCELEPIKALGHSVIWVDRVNLQSADAEGSQENGCGSGLSSHVSISDSIDMQT